MGLITSTNFGSIQLMKVSGDPSGIPAALGSLAIDITTNSRYKCINNSGIWELVITGVLPQLSPPLHAPTHIRSGSDPIDADLLDIDFVPTNYTRTTTGTGITGLTSTEHLTAHLKGIDNKLAVGGSDTYVLFNDGGAFGGDSGLVYNKTTNALTAEKLSGSLTRLSDGTSYIVAGSGITVTTGSNGSITITNDGAAGDITAVSAGTGLTGGGTSGAVSLAINNSVVATISGTTFTGATLHNAGLSGSLTKLTDGTSYIRAGSGLNVVTSSNGSITISQSGAAAGLPVINVVTDYGADPSGANSGGDAIQDAINAFMANPDDYFAVYIPPGVYRISQPLIVAVEGSFCGCNIISTLNAFPQGGNLGGAIIRWNTGTNPATGNPYGVEVPMMVIQGARNVSVQGINFEGPNTAAETALGDGGLGYGYRGLFSSSYESWIISGVIRDNPFSPQCAVAIDPFFNGVPGGTGSNMYPGLESYYNNGAFSATPKYQIGSSNIVFEYCSFNYNAFGVAVSPSGPTGSIEAPSYAGSLRMPPVAPYWVSGADKIQNGENFLFKNCFWNHNRVHFSQGQSQSRANVLFSPRMLGSYFAIDDTLIGPRGNAGVSPVFAGAPNIGGCKYVFNLSNNSGMTSIKDMYFESVASLGRIGMGLNPASIPTSFDSCNMTFIDPSDSKAQSNRWPGVMYHFSGLNGLYTFNSCNFYTTENQDLRFWNNNGYLKFNGCKFNMTGVATSSINPITAADGPTKYRGQVSFSSPLNVRMDMCQVRHAGGARVQDDPRLVGMWSETNSSTVTFTQTDSYGLEGKFSVGGSLPLLTALSSSGGSAGYIGIGDIIVLTTDSLNPELRTGIPHPSGSADSAVPTLIDGQNYESISYAPFYRYNYLGPVARVKNYNLDGGNYYITASMLPNNFPFGQSVGVKFFRWDITDSYFP